MTKTKVSVSYCGGCNAGYDRVQFVKDLLEKVGEHLIEMTDRDAKHDVALILAGCQALCVADRADLGAQASERYVIGPTTLNAVQTPHSESLNKLCNILTQKKVENV